MWSRFFRALEISQKTPDNEHMIVPLDNSHFFESAILELIHKAKSSDTIIANYFVVRDDPKGLNLLKALSMAATRGANVKLIIDAYGCLFPGDEGTEYEGSELTPELLNIVRNCGVDIHIYRPIKSTNIFALSNILAWENYSRRNHNKNFIFNLKSDGLCGIVVGDSQWAIEHFNEKFRGNNCLIYDRDVYRDATRYIEKLLATDHLFNYKNERTNLTKQKYIEIRFKKINYTQSIDWSWKLKSLHFEAQSIEFVYSDIEFKEPYERHTIQHYEMDLLKKAKKEIFYSTPYFCPDIEMQHAFIAAELSSHLHLRILIAKFRDHPYMPYGTEKASKFLMKYGIKIYEYSGSGNIHYKDLIVDDISFIKTANGEGRSRFYNLETGVLIKSQAYADYNRLHMREDINQSVKLHKQSDFTYENDTYWIRRFSKTLLRPLFYRHL